jgi:hypothetical protein
MLQIGRPAARVGALLELFFEAVSLRPAGDLDKVGSQSRAENTLRSGSEQFHAELWPNNATRLSRIDWLWSAKRACGWVTGGGPPPGQSGEPTHAHLHHWR